MAQSCKPLLKSPSSSKAPGKQRHSLYQRLSRIPRRLKTSLKFVCTRSPGSTCCPFLLHSRTPKPQQETPSEFQCRISNSLMHEPVSVPTGQSFELACIETCSEFNYIPCSSSSSFELTPKDDLKSKILPWCNGAGHPHPLPISQEEARDGPRRRAAFRELCQTVFSEVAGDGNSEKNDREQPPSSSPISRPMPAFKAVENLSSTIKNMSVKIEVKKASPRATFSPPSSSYFFKAIEILSAITSTDVAERATSIEADPMEQEILNKLRDRDNSTREEALVTLYECARRSRGRRVSLCSHTILAGVVPKLHPRHPATQIIRATAFIGCLSKESPNRIKIVQSGAISRLVGVLANGNVAAHDLAVYAISNLAIEASNKDCIGSCANTISALVDHFCEPAESYLGRKHAGMAICRLCFSCPDNLMRLAETAGAVQKLLSMTTDITSNEAKNLGGFAMVVVCKLAWISEARKELIEADAVEVMLRMVRKGAGDNEEYCLVVMYHTCNHDLGLFKKLAISTGAEEVLSKDKKEWGEVGREMARRMLDVIRHEDCEPVNLLQMQSVEES